MFSHASRHLLTAQMTPVVPRFRKENTLQREVAQNSCTCKKHLVHLCSPALLFFPLFLPLATILGWGILVWRFGHFAYTFCSGMALSNIDKKLMVLPLLKTLELTKYFEPFKESTGNSSHPDNVLFLFGNILVCIFKTVFASTETPAQVLSSFVKTTVYNLVVLFSNLTFSVNV